MNGISAFYRLFSDKKQRENNLQIPKLKFQGVKVNLQFPYLAVEGGAVHAEETRGLGLVAAGLAECGQNPLSDRIGCRDRCARGDKRTGRRGSGGDDRLGRVRSALFQVMVGNFQRKIFGGNG